MPDSPTPLDGLRQQLDALDHRLLQTLAERMAVVSKIAAYKREAGMPVLDEGREHLMLQHRERIAEELGLPKDVITSIFKLLLVASRNHQAALRVGSAPAHEQRTVAIIGGKGQMGVCMAQLFAELGHRVLIADCDTALTPVDAAKDADVTVLSVPIRATEAVVRQVGPHLRKDALLMDVTSIKALPMQWMLAATQASVVGTHPMFGPGVHSLQGQRIVLCKGRGEAWFNWLEQAFSDHGLLVSQASPEHHDRMMAVVQVLNHYQTQVMGWVLARYGIRLSDSMPFTSPAYLVEAYVTARHFDQSPELYGAIEMLNQETGKLTELYQQVAGELADILKSDDQRRFNDMFAEVREFFGDFRHEAADRSSFLIDRLIELTAGMPPSMSSERST